MSYLAKFFPLKWLPVLGMVCFFPALFSWSLGPDFYAALVACWVIGVGIFVAKFLLGQARRGATVLALGRLSPAPALKLFSAAIFLLLGFQGWFFSDWIYACGLPLGAWSLLFGIAYAILFVLECFYTLQIVEDGLWLGWKLFKWDDLESFHWKEGVNPSLVLQTKYRHSFLEPLPIPVIHKDAVSNLLKQHGVHQLSEQ